MPHPLMQTPLYLFICVHFLCPFYAHMPIYGDLCICLCPFYAYYTLAQMPRSLYLPIYRDLCIGLCPFYAHIRRYLSIYAHTWRSLYLPICPYMEFSVLCPYTEISVGSRQVRASESLRNSPLTLLTERPRVP